MIQIHVETDEQGQREGVIRASFSVGQIHPARTPESRTILLQMDCQRTMDVLKMSMLHCVQQQDVEGFDNALDGYCRMWLMQQLGLEMHPLQFKSDGTIDGIEGEYELIQD